MNINEIAKEVHTNAVAHDWLSDEWKMSVGEVVLNRVASPDFPETIADVIYQPGQYYGANSRYFEQLRPNMRCVDLARRLLEGERVLNDSSVVYQANFAQGEVHTAMYDRALGWTYFCKGQENRMLEVNKIHNMDCLSGLQLLESESVNCCVTSPPYYGLRDYGVPGQIGLEDTPEQYIKRLVEVFHEVQRVMRDDGTLWLNIGDSYAGSGKGQTQTGCADPKNTKTIGMALPTPKTEIPPKNLIGIPWMLAFALRADGWYLRQDIIWAKPNPMPESVTDRCTKSHEYMFLLSKSPRYYFDSEAIAEPVAESTIKRLAEDIDNQQGSFVPGKKEPMKAVAPRYGGKKYTENPDVFNRTKSGSAYEFRPLRNKRDVWTVTTQPFKEAHFATFPPKLIEPCILAGCPVGGIVLDPFMGSGTTAMVSTQLQRNYIGFELNPDYINIADTNRLSAVQLKIV